MTLYDTFWRSMPWRYAVFRRDSVRAFLLGLCVLLSLFLPSYVYASSFSDMLSSLTPSTASSWKGNGEDTALHHEPKEPPTPAEKPSWITERGEVSSEQLLDADGHWNVVEQGREYDPAQAHLNARKKVNTARRKKMKSLSPHFKPDAKSGQDGKLRILQIEPEEGVDYDTIEGAPESRRVSLLGKVFPTFNSKSPELAPPPVSTIIDPTLVVALEVEMLEADVFGEDVFEVDGIIIPKRKPNRWGGGTLASAAEQPNAGGVMLVRSDSKVRMIDGVAIPPAMPARKKVVQAYVGDAYVPPPVPFVSSYSARALSDADFLIESSTDGLMDGVIIPKRKPIKSPLLRKKPEFKPALTSMLSVFDDVEDGELSAHIVPVPRVKPKVVPVVLENGSVSKRTVSVKNLRSGMHPDKTRVVIEVSGMTEYKVTIDSLRNVLRVKLFNTRWDISPQDKLKGSALLGTYIARQQKDGSVLLEVRLKDRAEIVGTMVLRPNISSSHRIVVDLRAL